MSSRSAFPHLLVLLAPLLMAAGVAPPLPPGIRFEVPINLTDLPNAISKVAVECEVAMPGVVPANSNLGMVRTGRTELNVVAGNAIGPVHVLVTIPSFATTTSSGGRGDPTYSCALSAFVDEGIGWVEFVRRGPASTGTPLSLTSLSTWTAPITGSFQW